MSPRAARTSPPLRLAGIGLFAGLELAIALATGGEIRKLVLALLGVLIGATLLLARFGFAAAFRDAATRGDARPFVAQMLMMALASLLIVPLVAAGSLFGRDMAGFANPIGISFVLGGLL
ncbi:MAG: YeeE/YedE family protein, partial [Methylobacteriaceae bacterium]|nr:YeeE/YedE family protein [Methylobacteriaceae bacterium]